jgi:1-acyl-sn-glycerol-3-phosphate acyltransferase
MSVESLKAAWYWLARWGCRVFCVLLFRFRAYGTENVPESGGFILASNHQSYLDPVFGGVALRRRLSYVARDSLFGNRPFALLIRSLNAIPVRRGHADVAAVKTIIARLEEGKGVCLYPEGTRTIDGRISAFRPGLGLLCRRTRAAVVPVLIEGAFDIWPRHRKIFTFGPVTVRYGEAVSAEQVGEMDDRKLAEVLTERIRRMQNECRCKHGKEAYDYGA